MVMLSWAGITILLSLIRLDIATEFPAATHSSFACQHILSKEVVRWDGRDNRTRLWLLTNSKEVWDLDRKQLVMLDNNEWQCTLNVADSKKIYTGDRK